MLHPHCDRTNLPKLCRRLASLEPSEGNRSLWSWYIRAHRLRQVKRRVARKLL